MGLFANLLGTWLGGGEKPTVPEAPALDEAQRKAISANIEALPGAEELVSKANAFNIEQINKMLEAAIPNYGSLTSKAGANIESLLRGEIPKDIASAISRSDAAKALSGGYSGTGFHGNLVARDLGLTSLDLTQRGLSSAEGWITMMDRLFSPGTINVSSMFISPGQQYAADENAWGVQWLKNQIEALPDPLMEAIGQTTGGVIDITGASIASYYLGGQTGQYIMQGNSEYSGRNAPEYQWMNMGGGGGGMGGGFGGGGGMGMMGGMMGGMGGGGGGGMSGGQIGGMMGGMMGGMGGMGGGF